MSEDPSDDEMINFPVPKRHWAVVVRALADVMGDTPPPVSSLPPNQSRQMGWTKDEILHLKDKVRNPTVITLLNLTAERAGEWVDFSELRKATGRTLREAMGDLAGFTRLVKSLGKTGQDGWPIEVKFGVEPQEPTRYRMQPNIAQWWREA